MFVHEYFFFSICNILHTPVTAITYIGHIYTVYIHLKDLIAKNLEKISQLYPTDRKKAILPTTKPSVILSTEFALKVSTTLSTSVDHAQIGHQRNAEKDSEVLDLIGEDVIGNFDQIIIDQDQDGAIIVTKKKKEG